MSRLDYIHALKECYTTLNKTSEDSANASFMTNSKLKAVDFDKVKENYLKEKSLVNVGYKSVDAILIRKDTPEKSVLIEFKNGDFNRDDIIGKIKDSLLILLDLTQEKLDILANNIDFILVTNKVKAKEFISSYVSGKAKKCFDKYGLHIFEGVYFNRVHTFNKEQFEEYLAKNFVRGKLN